MSTALVPGSLGAIAQRDGLSMAESFLSADVIVIVDVSGSMDTCDSRGNKRRYDVACSELAKLQASMPGKIGVIAFSNDAVFCPGGVPPFLAGGTDLERALQFVKVADGTVSFVVISDGCPQDPEGALRVAAKFKSKISCIYVGPEDYPYGADFLRKLAAANGGQYVVASKAQELANKMQQLMLAAG